jgi:hypothetical protein
MIGFFFQIMYDQRQFVDACRKIWRVEGFRGLYVGYTASMCTHIPSSAVTWAVYEQLRRWMYRKTNKKDARELSSDEIEHLEGERESLIGWLEWCLWRRCNDDEMCVRACVA